MIGNGMIFDKRIMRAAALGAAVVLGAGLSAPPDSPHPESRCGL